MKNGMKMTVKIFADSGDSYIFLKWGGGHYKCYEG